MNFRRFVKKSIDIQKTLLIVLISISAVTGLLAFFINGESTVYRDELILQNKPVIDIYSAGMRVEILAWDGDVIKVECVAELPLIIEETEDSLKISQDDGFVVSVFTLDMFSYRMVIYLPRSPEFGEYTQVNIHSAGKSEVLAHKATDLPIQSE
jgi:hypothetical protein